MKDRLEVYFVHANVHGEKRWAFSSKSGAEVDFNVNQTINSVLTRKTALKAIEMARSKAYGDISIDRLGVTVHLTEADIRILQRQQLIEDKGLTLEEISLLAAIATVA